MLVGLCRRRTVECKFRANNPIKIKLEKKQSRNREMYSRAISLQKVSPIYMIF